MGGNFPEDERAHETIISGTKLYRMKQLEEIISLNVYII